MMQTQDLINKLTNDHKKRPFWKGPKITFVLFFLLLILVTCFELFTGPDLILQSSFLYMFLGFLVATLSSIFFVLNLRNARLRVAPWGFFSLVFLVLTGFIYDALSGHMVFEREVLMAPADVTCFSHIIFWAIPMMILAPILMRQFFVTQKKWAMVFMSVAICVTGILAMDLKCHNREFWHLIWGHQSTYFVIFFIVLSLYYGIRKLSFSAP